MKNNKPSIDGFIPRRTGSQIGDLHSMKNPDRAVEPIDRSLHTGDNQLGDLAGVARQDKLIGRSDLDESLREIDDPLTTKKPRRGRRARKDRRIERPRRKVGKIIAWIAGIILVIGLGVAGYVVLKAVLASNSVFQGSVFDLVKNEPLKEDKNGRTNFVLFGTAEDDDGGNHGGANLTDSIMVLSLDQEKNNAYMVSLPRDLWVAYQETCTVGNQGKLNAAYFCASNDGEDEEAGAAALQAKVGEITGLDIHYYVHLNFTAVTEAVDAVGGIDVTIETSDPRGILDRNFDWRCNYTCYYVNYKNGEVAHLDGEHALALARARNAAGGYGLPGGNFDREQNQQKIIRALQEKALSAGTLTNLGAVTGLLDTLGKNLRTNIQTKEIRTLMDIGTKLSPGSFISVSLVAEDDAQVTTGSFNGQSIVQPRAGLYNYSGIKEYIDDIINADPVSKEDPHVTILNGSGTAGVASAESDKLSDFNFTVDQTGNAPDGTYERVEIYQINADKTASAAKLKEVYGVELKTVKPPVSVVGTTDFLIIIGTAQQ